MCPTAEIHVVSRNNFLFLKPLMKKLNQKKVKWIVRQCEKRSFKQKDIAYIQGVSARRVRQLHSEYKETGTYPALKRCGRKRRPVSGEVSDLVVSEARKTGLGALYLEKHIRKLHGIHVPHNVIHMLLLGNGLARAEPAKRKRRKWVRYEREHSLSLVHTDWHEHKGRHVIAFLDDASRDVLSCMEFDRETSANTLLALEEAIRNAKPFGGMAAVLTDNGSQFVPTRESEKGRGTAFQRRLAGLGIEHIRSGIKHPQTNGKIEKWFDCFDRHRDRFEELGGFIEWYRTVKPHRSLDFEDGETPSEAFRRKLRPEILLGLMARTFGW